MSQRQITTTVTDLDGLMRTFSVSLPTKENSHTGEKTIQELIDDDEISMNDIIPSGSEGHLMHGQPKQHLEETGIHHPYRGRELLKNYQARREAGLKQY